MNLSSLSTKHPIFITCLVLLMIVFGYVSMTRLGIEQFPDITPPVVVVVTSYPGTGASEMETLVTKPLEDAISTIAGVKRVTSKSIEGVSQITAEFYMDQDIKVAEQHIRDKASATKVKFPRDVKDPLIYGFDLSDMPIVTIALRSDKEGGDLFNLADQIIKPRLQQLRDVGDVKLVGGRKNEVQVLLDRDKLKKRGFSAAFVAARLAESGANIPAGKINEGSEESVFRSRGEFHNTNDSENNVLSLFGNDNATHIYDVATVSKALEEEKNRVYVDGNKAILIEVYKQSKTNTVALAGRVIADLPNIEQVARTSDPSISMTVVRDSSHEINTNILDVKESIFIGIFLTVVVVFLFLGNVRSTIITGLALPNSLIGTFVLMYAFGLTINIITLLALSLVVGLLIDDAIVVRENIFRYLESGMNPEDAAKKGTDEVTLAVIATSLVVISVFGPIALTQGMIGRILANFGLVICFAMTISLFDALTM